MGTIKPTSGNSGSRDCCSWTASGCTCVQSDRYFSWNRASPGSDLVLSNRVMSVLVLSEVSARQNVLVKCVTGIPIARQGANRHLHDLLPGLGRQAALAEFNLQ